MADNTRANPGVGGDLIATDEVVDGTLGTVKVQYVKIMDGTLDGTNKAAVGTNGVASDVKASVLPTGASTAAKQPALGTAGTASADVISVQGIASGTALTVSGTVTANAGTNLNTSTLALETGGNLATVAGAVSGAKMQTQANAATVPAATTMQNGATATGNGVNLNVQGYAAAIINIVSSPAMSGGTTITFEASVDDTTFVAIAGHAIGTNGSLSTTTTADGDFRFATAGYKSLRARISTYSAGTITAKGYVSPTASQPTAVALASGANTIGALTANQSVNISQINGSASTAGAGTTAAGTQRVVLATDTTVPNVTGNVASGGSDSGNPVKVGGVFNTTPPTLTTGQRGDAQMNSAASLRMTEADLLAGENLSYNRLMALPNYSYTNITTNATTTAKSGPGFLHSISINNVALLTVANLTLTVWDNTAASGTKVGIFTVPFGLTTALPFEILFDSIMTTGITIQTAGPTVTADVTVCWL